MLLLPSALVIAFSFPRPAMAEWLLGGKPSNQERQNAQGTISKLLSPLHF